MSTPEALIDDSSYHGWNIQQLSVEQEISESYINYAMSVIVSRALPDTRDGMKPVIRRILYAMNELGMTHNTKHKKSARIVWEVLWKYHPHGDSSVYEAMVRLAQPWSMRYPLVDGQGNFWSIDGDGAASMRYTEARLTKLAGEMLDDIDQDTVAWRPNFDNSLNEPITLPTKFPNHLCNGTMGIAVGMATNMAPHNLREVIDASLYYMEHGQETTIEDLMTIIKGPDFPTGWFIFDPENILEIYRRGKWSIIVRGKTHIEQSKHGDIIVIDQIPYQINKSSLVEKIGELVVDKRIDGITDIRDESAKGIIRVTIHIRRGANAQKILTQLYKMTDLQSSFAINNVSLIEKGRQPRLLNILDLISEFVIYRREIVYRRSVFQLGKAKDRLHILEGLRKAISIIDEVIATIRHSDTKQEAKEQLMKKFEFSDPQAEHILLMRLQSLVGLELNKIIEEIGEKEKLIAYLEDIVNNPSSLDNVVKEEMHAIKHTYGDERRTILIDGSGDVKRSLKEFENQADQEKEDVIVRLNDNFDLRVLYQSRISVIPEDTIDLIYTHNQDKIIVITDIGELVVQRLKDFGSFQHNSIPLNFHTHFWLKGRVIFAKTLHAPFDHLLLMTTDNNIKKVDKNMVLSFKKFPTSIMKLPGKNEKVVNVLPVSDTDTIGIATKHGRLLLFKSSELRPMGKTAGGIKGIELQEGDTVGAMFLYQQEPFILLNTSTKALMLTIDDLRIRKRAKKWDQVVDLDKGESIVGGISIYEWAIRVRLNDGSIQTIHSNDCYLDEPGASPESITKKPIENMFRPREEKKENVVYKEVRKEEEKAKKLAEQEGDEETSATGLFASDTNKQSQEEDTIPSEE